VAAVLLLSGCGASSRTSMGAAASGGAPAVAGKAPQANPQAAASGNSGPLAPPPPTDAKSIAYTAQLTVQVHDVRTAADTARHTVEASGGAVAAENVSAGKDDGAAYEEHLTLKVPSFAHEQSLDQLSSLGRLLSLNSQADDVTQQVVDVDSRLKSQQASVDRIRALMSDAKSLSEVVTLEGELSHREADLESLQQQQRALAARTSMSTITLDLVRDDQQTAPPPAEHHGFWGSIGGALSGGWHILLAIAEGLLIGLAAAAPFLALLAPVAWYLLRRRRRRTAPESPVE
jgi:hypothetical protein